MPTLAAAFAAGVVSFLSPCVFPLVPGYLSYIAGTTVKTAEAKEGSASRRLPRVTLHSLSFVCGFALIFVLLGATASTLGTVLNQHLLLLTRASGALLVIFGIVMTGLVPLPFIQRERRLHLGGGSPTLLRSGVTGVAFGAGWSPCVGPLLGTILALSATSTSLSQGVLLLLIYTLGLGAPFLLVGVLIDAGLLTSFVRPLVKRINRYTGPIALVGGIIVALTGILILTGRLTQLAGVVPTA